MQGAVRQQTDGVPLVDAQTRQFFVRVGQNAGSPGGIGQGHIASTGCPAGSSSQPYSCSSMRSTRYSGMVQPLLCVFPYYIAPGGFGARGDDLKWPPRALWPSSAEELFIISQFWKICGFSRIAFSREGSWREAADATPLSAKARRCGESTANLRPHPALHATFPRPGEGFCGSDKVSG